MNEGGAYHTSFIGSVKATIVVFIQIKVIS